MLGVVIAGLTVGGFVLGPHVANLHNGLIAASFAGVGLFLLHRRPGNREGRLFVAVGAAHAVMFFGREYGLHAGPLPGASWIGWLGVWPLPLVLVLVGAAVMCFPTGRLPSRAWAPVLGVLCVLGFVLSLVSALWPVEYARTGLGHPFSLPGLAVAQAFYDVARPVAYLLFQLTWVVCVIVRVRRSDGDEGRQLRWFLYAATVSAAVMIIGLAVWGSPVPGTLTVPLLAVAAGAAILRYRLYDIDPVINKSLVFGVMAGVVTLGYAVVVVGAGRLVDGYGTWLSLLAIGVVAVVFEPLRSRAQRLADRVVYGRRATPYEALARLSAHFSAPAGGLLDGICATVADAAGAREVVLWTGSGEELRAVAAWPPAAVLPAGVRSLDDLDAGPASGRVADQLVVPVKHDGRLRGALMISAGTLSAAEQRLVGDLAAQAGLVLELRAAAQRLVVAGDAARRRLERDLHDGAQQRLVTVAMELGGVVRLATTAGATEVAGRADDVRRNLLEATAELREMARGLHPAVLTQDGLEAAIGFLADRASLPVRLAMSVSRRLPAEVESTAYFVVSEGLTNAAKYSGASSVSVFVEIAGPELTVEVSDDGCGGASVRPGGGLEGLSDRLAILDARLTIDSGPAGTLLRTVIPCG
ncbi:histidine kinase [Actinoplanes lutulentus]|uniref:histidine kinase n=2 Tax=Actinoplanes lutulentus TaxID=1287878 RepID=A0A327Z512_9ACTN|nr:histidine kinase [Actinoplanes lutulentus]